MSLNQRISITAVKFLVEKEKFTLAEEIFDRR